MGECGAGTGEVEVKGEVVQVADVWGVGGRGHDDAFVLEMAGYVELDIGCGVIFGMGIEHGP